MTTENLYVVKFTLLDPKGPTEPSFNVTLPATFTDLNAAKNEAKTTLAKSGYDTDFFKVYDVNDGSMEWKYGDGVIVYAEGSSKEQLKVEIETVPNLLSMQADISQRVKKPLYHVLQTVIEYNNDRSGSQRYTVIEGTYRDQDRARAHALQVLLGGDTRKEDFVEYDEYAEDSESSFDGHVVVHAVREDGQNILVSVISEDESGTPRT